MHSSLMHPILLRSERVFKKRLPLFACAKKKLKGKNEKVRREGLHHTFGLFFKRNKVDTFISSQQVNPRTLNRKGANH